MTRRGSFIDEVRSSSELLFSTQLSWLLLLGPLALAGSTMHVLGESTCFVLAGMALIPCAERLSFVTEQVAAHTNETIGALLNATFGNAPELLISKSALRAGLYRVVQLTLLGSILTNLLFVFGLSCLMGGMRWKVQQLRMTSGNVSVGMLLLATAGLLLPAVLKLTGEGSSNITDDFVLSKADLGFSRANALIMILVYICYLLFQLGSHIDEFADSTNSTYLPPAFRTRENVFCMRFFPEALRPVHSSDETGRARNERFRIEMKSQPFDEESTGDHSSLSSTSGDMGALLVVKTGNKRRLKRQARSSVSLPDCTPTHRSQKRYKEKSKEPGYFWDDYSEDERDAEGRALIVNETQKEHMSDTGFGDGSVAEMPLRMGILWLFIITICVSSLSDIIVDTIDGFALRYHISEILTSVVIIPFFSNIAEQVSAVLFAYRNKMDLCVGVTVGSAVQIALFVAPGCVLIGWWLDRSMTLFFRGYETCCLVLAVLCVAAVLQGGTTNWLVGVTLLSMYLMMASGFYFHEMEDLSTDAETISHNITADGGQT